MRGRRARWTPRPARRGRPAAWLLAGVAAVSTLLGGCAARGGPETGLPPMPDVRGELDLYVAYPDSADPIAARDSNFIFGTTGTGAAELTIDGRSVPVRPNGSFLAWLPVPERSAGDTAVYRLVARAGGRADTVRHPVVLSSRPYRGEGRAWIDSTSVTGLPSRWALPREWLELTARAAPDAELRIAAEPAGPEAARGAAPDTLPARRDRADTGRGPSDTPHDSVAAERPGLVFPMTEVEPGRYRLRIRADSLARAAAGDTVRLRFRASAAGDTARVTARFPLRILDPAGLPLVTLREAPDSVHGESGVVAGRPAPDGPYAWLFPTGSRALADGLRGDRVRLRLAGDLSAWVPREDVVVEKDRVAGLRARTGWVRAEDGPDLRVRIPLDRRLPAAVRMETPRALDVTLFGGVSGTGRMIYPPGPSLLSSMEWAQLPGPRYRLRVRLTRPAWGWRLRWDGSTAVLEVREAPRVDPDRPLRGQRVAVDPGHPPVGAEGPTGLEEAEANLAVARQLVALLEEAGAEPVLVRRDTAPVGLYERRRRAREAGATTLVSVHNNALPDGLRPFGRAGTSTYYFHPHARLLGKLVQRGMLARMGLRDLGLRWGNLALPRESWIPTVLAEGAFMMFPRHEAALRTPAFQRAYARGVLDGLREFYRARGRTEGRGDRRAGGAR